MRRAARIDQNHLEIAAEFRARGWFVRSTAALGDGFPDLLIAKRGILRQVEIKDGERGKTDKRALQLKPDQVTYHAELLAAGVPVLVIDAAYQVGKVDLTLMQPTCGCGR